METDNGEDNFLLSIDVRYESMGIKRIRDPRSPCCNAEYSMSGGKLIY